MSAAGPSSTPGTSQAAQTAGTGSAATAPRKAGSQDAADLFANLLSLLSASSDAPLLPQATDALPADATADPLAPQAGADANLMAMMQWADLPQGSGKARAASAGAEGPLPNAATPAGTTPTTSAPDPMLQGMQLLAQPEAADAQTLGALAARSEGAATDPLTSAMPAAPEAQATTLSAPTARHTITTAARTNAPNGVAHTQALQQAHHSHTQAERLQVRVDTPSTLALRSTVTLDGRFAASSAPLSAASFSAADDGPAPSTGLGQTALIPGGVAALATGSGADTGPGGQPGDDAEAGAPVDASPRSLSDDLEDSAYDRAADELEQAEERLDAFTTGTLREASLRVGESDADAIDIRLSLNGQELNLGFRTDDPEARAALARHAQGSLSDLLQRGGIQLGEVSVGAQNGQSAGGDNPSSAGRPPGTPGAALNRAGGEPEAPSATTPRPRHDGSRPLDLFV